MTTTTTTTTTNPFVDALLAEHDRVSKRIQTDLSTAQTLESLLSQYTLGPSPATDPVTSPPAHTAAPQAAVTGAVTMAESAKMKVTARGPYRNPDSLTGAVRNAIAVIGRPASVDDIRTWLAQNGRNVDRVRVSDALKSTGSFRRVGRGVYGLARNAA